MIREEARGLVAERLGAAPRVRAESGVAKPPRQAACLQACPNGENWGVRGWELGPKVEERSWLGVQG